MGLELRVAFRDTLQLLAHRAMATVRAVSDALNRILQLRHLLPQLAYLPLQGLSDVGAPLGHIVAAQVHVLLAVVRLALKGQYNIG